MRCKVFTTFKITLCLLCIVTGAFAQNKVLDGSFEKGTPFTLPIDIANQYKEYATGTTAGDWEITNSSIDKQNRLYLAMGTPTGGGDYNIDLNMDGRIEQNITGLIVSKKYKFSFYTRIHANVVNNCGVTGDADFEVRIGSVLHEALNLTSADVSWVKHSYTFIANAVSMNLSFEGSASCDPQGGALIDLVEIVESDPCDDIPRFAVANSDIDLCLKDGASEEVHLSATGGVSYVWSPASLFIDPTQATNTITVTKTTQVVVKVTNIDGCVDYDTVDINANPVPQNIAIAPSPLVGCLLSTYSIEATGEGVSEYTWSPRGGLDVTSGAKVNLTLFRGNSKYIVTGTNEYGCKSTDTLDIVINELPVLKTIPDTIVCLGDQVTLWVNGASTYSWTPADNMTNSNSANPLLDVKGNEIYTVIGTDSNGCTNSSKVEVSSIIQPLVKASKLDYNYGCDSVFIQLGATGASKYIWQPALYCDDSSSATPFVRIPYDVRFIVEGISSEGCSAYDTILVAQAGVSKIIMPNAFTPNGDNLNDDIKPLLLCNYEVLEYSVFNRWGQLVFNTTNPNEGWSGRFSNQQDASVGVYYYVIKGRNSAKKEFSYEGEFTLIR